MKSGPGSLPGRALAARRGRRPQPRPGRGLRAATRRRALARRCRGDHPRAGRRHRVRRDDDRVASRLRAALRRGGKARAHRKADGDEPRRLPRDDRGLPRRERPAVGRLLPARAAALPQGARTRAGRRDRRHPHGDHAALPAHSDPRSDARAVLGLAARSGALRRRHLLRSGRPHARHPGLHPRADRERARVRGQPGGRLPAGGHRDGGLPVRVRRLRQRRLVLHRRLRRRIQRNRRRHGAHPFLDVSAALAPGRPPAGADSHHARRCGGGNPDRRPALRAPAADPDDRRRDERPGSLPEQRRNGGAHRARASRIASPSSMPGASGSGPQRANRMSTSRQEER